MGLTKAADWLDVECDRWVQDRFKDRIMQLVHDIRDIAAKSVNEQTVAEEKK